MFSIFSIYIVYPSANQSVYPFICLCVLSLSLAFYSFLSCPIQLLCDSNNLSWYSILFLPFSLSTCLYTYHNVYIIGSILFKSTRFYFFIFLFFLFLTLLRCSFLSVYPSIHPSTRPWHIPSPTLWMGMVPTNSPVGLQIIIRIYKPTIGWYHGRLRIYKPTIGWHQ